MTKTEKDEKTARMMSDAIRAMLPYTNLGWTLLATVLLFFGAGYGLDAWLRTSPWCTVSLAALGVVVAMVSLVKQVLNDSSHNK